MDQVIVEITSTATIAIAVFGIVFSLLQTEHSYVRRCFAMFLSAVAINNLPDALARVLETMDPVYALTGDLIVWFPSTLCLAPLFWLYVHAVTAPANQRPERIYRHLVLPGLAMIVGCLVAVTPGALRVVSDAEPTTLPSGWSLGLIAALVALQLAVYFQVGVYLFLVVRRLMRYRIQLRDVYSSTEAHELRWIYVIGGLGAVFWLTAVLLPFLAVDPAQLNAFAVVLSIASLSGLALVAVTTLWGLRQRPPLVPDVTQGQALHSADVHTPEHTSEKYEKSALSPEAANRIARKLRMAMEQDHLHRDANLSLWGLARHIGASPNYVSQTLSEVIGESFFDFVNAYRIAEAKELLAQTDDTVLAITYEVGFNARSSFYNAFKRFTGQTPTGYRKTLSLPVGLDDSKA